MGTQTGRFYDTVCKSDKISHTGVMWGVYKQVSCVVQKIIYTLGKIRITTRILEVFFFTGFLLLISLFLPS